MKSGFVKTARNVHWTCFSYAIVVKKTNIEPFAKSRAISTKPVKMVVMYVSDLGSGNSAKSLLIDIGDKHSYRNVGGAF